jgi:hypothetical protein
MAEVFQQKTIRLAAALEHGPEHDAARQALGGFLDKVIIPPGDGRLQVVLGEMLTAASGGNGSTLASVGNGGCGGRQPAEFGVLLDRGEIPACLNWNLPPVGVTPSGVRLLISKRFNRIHPRRATGGQKPNES